MTQKRDKLTRNSTFGVLDGKSALRHSPVVYSFWVYDIDVGRGLVTLSEALSVRRSVRKEKFDAVVEIVRGSMDMRRKGRKKSYASVRDDIVTPDYLVFLLS